ncbi:hypothetical protein AN642_00715 [Epulopiscium sp. SCG-B10WGA-EpuloA2]|nr:hypothetical protein AN642_00715 [Epulopiscium sp. SCG-B10WGA-EpuloA2]
MEQDILVLYVKPYNFTNEFNQRLTGLSVYYIDPSVSFSSDIDGYGYVPIKVSVSSDKADKLKRVPAVYRGKFTIVPSARGNGIKL